MLFDQRGRYYRWNKRSLVTDFLRLDAHRMLSQTDMSRPSLRAWQWTRGDKKIASLMYHVRPEQRTVRLIYNYQKQPVEPYGVAWTTTRQHYGGRRYWWLCPACGRRCAHLYGGKIFACRQCYDLTYESAQTGDPRSERVERRMRAIRRRLSGDSSLLDPLPDRPKGMHWRTYWRLYWEYEKLDTLFLGDLCLLTGLDAEHPEIADYTAQCWAEYQQDPAGPPADPRRMLDAMIAADEEAPPPRSRRQPRRTITQTAKAAEIPLDFAQEAQQEGLLRPDAGRTARRKRYRPKVASWLRKLHRLRQAGYTWPELRAWSARRFTPGHEHERRWPAGYGAQTP